MRLVFWIDEQGYKHNSYVRDSDPDEMAPLGYLHDPPNLVQLDWEGIQRELHNLLVDRGLITLEDVQRQQRNVQSAIQAVLLRKMIDLYKQD